MKKSRWLIFALLVSLLAPISNASAETAKQQLQSTVDRVVQVLGTIRNKENLEKNKTLLRQILVTRFDFAAMAQKTLGNRWNELAGREQEFIAVFTDFIEGAYMGTLGAYQGETVIYENDRSAGELAEVDTRVVGGRGAPIEVEYKLRRNGEEWKVYDVVIDNVSVISNYQSQFRRILQKASLQELMQSSRAKQSAASSFEIVALEELGQSQADFSISSFQQGALEPRLTRISPDASCEPGCRQSMPA